MWEGRFFFNRGGEYMTSRTSKFKKKVTQSAYAKMFEDYAGVKDTKAKPKVFGSTYKKWFRPILAPMYTTRRELFDLMKLALTENRRVNLKEGEYAVDLKTGNCRLPFNKYGENEKKLATLHATSHLSITPPDNKLSSEEKAIIKRNKEVANLLEDVRVNRYICFKYPGMLRYMTEIKQKMLVDLCVGDLMDTRFDAKEYNENILTKLLFKYRNEIRKNETYGDVLKTAKMISDELGDHMDDFEMPMCGEGACGDDSKKMRKPRTDKELDALADQILEQLESGDPGKSCGGGSPMELSPEEKEKLMDKLHEKGLKDKLEKAKAKALESIMEDAKRKYEEMMCDISKDGMSETLNEAMSEILSSIGKERAKEKYGACPTPEQIKEMTPDLSSIDDEDVKEYIKEKMKEIIAKKALKEVLEDSMEGASEEEKERARIIFGEGKIGEFDKDDSVNKNHEVSVVKKPGSFFTASRSLDIQEKYLDKGLLKYLQKREQRSKKTRDGRLGKIDPVRKMSDGRLFQRRTHKKKDPHFHFVLDCSGSMGYDSLNWQSTIVKAMVRLLREAGIKYSLYAHSGTGKEFWYGEIEEKHLDNIVAHHYNLDGTMLDVLFNQHIKNDENSVVFYMSDGGLPAEFSFIEGQLIMKNMNRARKNNVPIIGIGLRTSDVEIFDEWHQIKNIDQMGELIEKMGKVIMRTVR